MLLGVPIHASTFDDTVTSVLSWADERGSRTAHFCNVHLLVTGHDDPAVRAALETGTLNAMDGLPLVWLGRALGYRAERVAGPDLMLAVMDRGRAGGRRHYLYGATAAVTEALERRLTASLPGLRIVGRWSPPFGAQSDDERDADVARIQATEPDFVWVGLGAPKQDLWVEAARHWLHAGGLLAVGAAFDFHSGVRRRAPRWMQRTGTEWLFRLVSEPRRLWRRYAVTNTRFVYLAARQIAARRLRRGERGERA
jgi:N-acetylglucosaminyldiphosphoundecaprenol N-acetyl-beta-D-mannosaminyltransferase